MCIDFEESSYTVCEGDGNSQLCLIVTGDLGRDVTVTFQTMDDSANCMCYMKFCEQLVSYFDNWLLNARYLMYYIPNMYPLMLTYSSWRLSVCFCGVSLPTTIFRDTVYASQHHWWCHVWTLWKVFCYAEYFNPSCQSWRRYFSDHQWWWP